MKRNLPLYLSLLVAWTAAAAQALAGADLPRLTAEAAQIRAGQSLQPFRAFEDVVRQSLREPGLRKEVITALIKLLEPASTFEARRFACKQLGIVGTPAALPALANLLQDEQTAGIACLALTTYPAGKADSVLRSALASARGIAQIQIINTLGDRRDAKALGSLAGLGRSADQRLAAAAIAAIGKIGTKPALETLAEIRREFRAENQPRISQATLVCADRLATDGEKKAAATAYEVLLATREPLPVRRAALAALLRLDKDHGQGRILTTLRGSDESLKPVAIAGVRVLPQKEASRQFAAELPRLTSDAQVWLVQALAARGDAAGADAVNQAIISGDPLVRRAAIASAAALGKPASAPMLIRALSGCTDPEEGRAIESALVSLSGGKDTNTQITGALEGSSGSTRAHLINAISLRQGAAANPLLFKEAEGADSVAAKAAFRALTRTATAMDAPRVLREVAEIGAPDIRSEAESVARKTLTRVESSADRSRLVIEAIRQAQKTDGKAALIGFLPICGDAPALAAANKALADRQERVRTAAIEALAEWPDDSGWEPLAGVLKAGQTEGNRTAAFRGLIRIATDQNAKPSPALIQRYRELFDHAHGDADLKLILGSLGSAAHPEALQLAVGQLEHAAVRAEAEAAVKKIAEAIKAKHPQEAAAALQQVSLKK